MLELQERSVDAKIRSIGALARAHATPILFAVVPVFDRDLTPIEGVNDDLMAIARQAGLVPVNLLHVLRDSQPGTFALQAPVGADPWHSTPAGQARIAGALAAAVRPVAAPAADRRSSESNEPSPR